LRRFNIENIVKNLQRIKAKAIFRVSALATKFIGQVLRRRMWQLLGMKIGSGTTIPSIRATWPHKVKIGSACLIEPDIYFKFDGIWEPDVSICIGNNVFIGRSCEFNIRKRIVVGDDSLIASGCKFIDHDHGIFQDIPMRRQCGPEGEIHIGNDVWLGTNVVVLKRVHIGNGAVVAAGAVVTKNIPAGEIWGGIPARKIGDRPEAKTYGS
jgi:acetyltransferase-like isoleucine patch superfamily enzyme